MLFSDTHCHIFSQIDDGTINSILPQLQTDFCFIQDIGTKPDDFKARYKRAKTFFPEIPKSIRFSLGIWPDAVYISNIDKSIETLEKNIQSAIALRLPIALGECGLDRYWNGKNAKNHNPDQTRGTEDTASEEALFERQLELAKKYNLAVIVHTRDAATETLKVIDKVGYHRGVIHCYSYGITEAKQFLNRGWYISFSGNCTFATTHIKKAKTAELIKSIPLEKMLLETDAPFLSPTPYRGKPNNPLLVKYVYEKVAEILDLDMQTLGKIVFNNALKLFGKSPLQR